MALIDNFLNKQLIQVINKSINNIYIHINIHMYIFLLKVKIKSSIKRSATVDSSQLLLLRIFSKYWYSEVVVLAQGLTKSKPALEFFTLRD